VPRQLHVFDQPERFVAGTVGQPGERQFFLQARDGARVVSVGLEKQQVHVLAERVDGLLDEVVRRTGGEAPVPATAPLGSEDLDPLEPPVTEEFRVGAMGLGWNGDTEPGDHRGTRSSRTRRRGARPRGGPRRRSRVPAGAAHRRPARAFAKRALSQAAGPPPCPFCNLPRALGHICPRANGYRR
jgi:uncharacterized repeat protein (TIGR03847 family)